MIFGTSFINQLERIQNKRATGFIYLFRQPKYLATNERGWLLVADEDNHQIKIFDERYDLIGVIGDQTQGRGPDRLRKPEGVTTRGDIVWVSDTYNNRIVRFRLIPNMGGGSVPSGRAFGQPVPVERGRLPEFER